MKMDIDEAIIEEIRKQPVIYDHNLEDYRNQNQKRNAWREVARRVQLNETQCRKRWKGLRDCYKRVKRTERIAATPPRQKWKYYDLMSFLDIEKSSKRMVNICRNENSTEYRGVNSTFDDDYETVDMDDQSMIDSYPVANSQLHVSTKDASTEKDETKFNFIDVGPPSLSETAIPTQKSENGATALLFASLANMIKDTKMPAITEHRLRAQVSKIVFAEIDKFYGNQ